MNSVLYVLAAAMIVAGLVGAILPALPGIPLIFAGIWLSAGVDHYRHLSLGWLVVIAVIGAVGVGLELLAGALGARRIGASRRAVWGAFLGTVLGMFFGLPGLLLGPFIGAMLGELSAGNSVLRSSHVGVNTWIGLIVGTMMKLICSITMLAVFVVVWWWKRTN